MWYNPQSTDEEIRQGCIKRHPSAQECLYRRYFGRLLGVAMRYTNDRDEAVDVLNMAFLKIFNSMEQYQDTGSFMGWMVRIVLHTAIDHLRSQNAYRKMMDFTAIPDQTVVNEAPDLLHVEDLYRLIQLLPPATRTVFSLYVVDGYKHREIADMLGIDEGTSKWHLASARRELQNLICQVNQPTQ